MAARTAVFVRRSGSDRVAHRFATHNNRTYKRENDVVGGEWVLEASKIKAQLPQPLTPMKDDWLGIQRAVT